MVRQRTCSARASERFGAVTVRNRSVHYTNPPQSLHYRFHAGFPVGVLAHAMDLYQRWLVRIRKQ